MQNDRMELVQIVDLINTTFSDVEWLDYGTYITAIVGELSEDHIEIDVANDMITIVNQLATDEFTGDPVEICVDRYASLEILNKFLSQTASTVV